MSERAGTPALPATIFRALSAALFAAALAFALGRYGATEERSLYALFLLLLAPAALAVLGLGAERFGRWPAAALAIAGVLLLWRAAVLPPLEARGFVMAAVGWMGLIVALWLGEDRRFLRLLLICVFAAGALEALYGLTQALGGVDRIFEYQRKMGRVATGTLINRNHYAALLNMTLALGLGLLVAAHARAHRRAPASEAWARAWVIVLPCAVVGLALLLSRSRAGILTFALMGVFVGLLLYLGRRGRAPAPPPQLAALLVVVTLGLGLLVGLGAVGERFAGGLDPLRPTVYRDTLRLIADHPWTGVGAGMYGWRFQPYQSAPSDKRVLHAHSDYLEVAAEWGVPLALLAVGLVVWRLYRSVRAFLSPRSPGAQGLALGCAAAIFAVLAHGLVDFNLQIPANLLIFTVVLAASWSLERPLEAAVRSRWPALGLRLLVCAVLLFAGARVWGLLEVRRVLDGAPTVESLTRLLADEPRDAAAHAALGRLYRVDPQHRDLAASRRHLERALELDRWNRRHHFELGRTLEELEEWSGAEQALRRATAGNPANGDHLWHLARFHFLNGDREEMYAPLAAALAADGDLQRSAAAFVFNAELDPERIDEVWPADPAARLRLVAGLPFDRSEARRRYLPFALAEWRRILAGPEPPTIARGSFLVRALLAAGETEEARRQWSALARANGVADPAYEARDNEIWNGGFELPLAGEVFGWRVRAADGVRIARLEGSGVGDSAALAVDFPGRENLSFDGLQQTIVLAPGRYRFTFSARLEELTTDQGPFFRLDRPRDRDPLLVTERLTGSAPWRQYSADFEVPPDSGAVTLRLRREPSRRIDSRIAGRLLLDDLRLAALAGEGPG